MIGFAAEKNSAEHSVRVGGHENYFWNKFLFGIKNRLIGISRPINDFVFALSWSIFQVLFKAFLGVDQFSTIHQFLDFSIPGMQELELGIQFLPQKSASLITSWVTGVLSTGTRILFFIVFPVVEGCSCLFGLKNGSNP